MTAKGCILAGTILGFLGVVLGAFGAHGLAERLSTRGMEIYHTAAQYQMIHALALIALGIWANPTTNPTANATWAGSAFLGGVVIFSGSLYALALTDIKILGAITPVGGLLFLVGWISFAMSAWKS